MYITLPNGKAVSLGTYAKAWKELKRLDPQTRVPGWSIWETTAGDILREMREGLHDRINKHLGRSGRKYSSDYFYSMLRFAREINSRSVIHYIPSELRTRFAHRLSD